MNNVATLGEPKQVTWSDRLVAMEIEEVRKVGKTQAYGVRNAISKRLKFTHPTLVFKTWNEGEWLYIERTQ